MRFYTFLAKSLFLVIATTSTASGQATYLDQGWNSEEREEFYFTAQGSQLIPFTWFLELEQPESEQPFRDDENLRRYGFVTTEATKRNPHGLPVGFVRDGVDPVASAMAGLESIQKTLIQASTDFEIKKAYLGASFDQKYYPRERESWFGFTCAACHTHEIQYGDATLRIDGGSTQADVESFLRDLGFALKATWNDSEKLKRFAIRIGRSEKDLDEFEKEVKQISDAVNRLVVRNQSKHRYGYARLDAFGAILNAVCETALNEPDNHFASNAPVSYPSLWNTPKMGYVQWNASAPFAEARNVGEVLGVFGTYTLKAGDQQFDSTVRLRNLVRLEHDLLANLRSPDWPQDIFGKLEQARVRRGKKLFAKNCKSCHPVRDAEGQFALNSAGRIPIRSNTLPEVRTDPQFMKNLAPNRTVATGDLKPLLGNRDRVTRPEVLGLVVGAIIQKRAIAERVDIAALQPGPQDPPNPAGVGSGYISRPLEGIWASPPYFHNGSVPSLYETLLPAEERSKSFWVGNVQFDPVNVGFVTERSDIGFEFRVVDDAGDVISGNSNAGHDGFGANENEGFTQTFEDGAWRDFTDDERYELVEYMKSLSSRPAAPLELIPDGEEEQIAKIVELTGKQLRMRYPKGDRTLRGVHPKDHGCVTAKFEVLSSLPAEYAVGVFQPGAVYESFIRFSNASVRVGPDSTKAPGGKPVHGSRGMAIKLLGVKGKSLLPLHGALTQDLLMINQPAFAFANVEDYQLLSQVLVDDNDSGKNFFVQRLTTGTPEQKARALRTKQIVERVTAADVDGDRGAFEQPPASPVDNDYFSAAPFRFGDGRVMKFRASPVKRSCSPPDVDDPNYLRTALIKRLATETVVFDFAIQVRDADQLDLATDIENASLEWHDKFVTVARITIPPQEFDSPSQREQCERLFFTPWHGISEHTPLGGINRLRKAVYLASGEMRNLPKEPESIGN